MRRIDMPIRTIAKPARKALAVGVVMFIVKVV
jgi:hypothetical protein